jgi:SAM-dependent methyltransferase
LAEYFNAHHHDKQFVDIGCGPGVYVDALRSAGENAIGFDTDARVKDKENLVQASLFGLNYPGDVVLCLEVAEHIPESQADDVVASMVRNTKKDGMLVWTAAVPGQGGHGHINCQPKEYWEQKFCDAGMRRDLDEEQRLLEFITTGSHMGWFANNLMILRHV